MIVVPVQTLRVAVPEWADKVGDQRAYLSTVDDEFAFAVRDRGLKVQWAFPPDLARSARRNPGYTADPYAITLAPLQPVERDPDKLIAEPLAGQLRTFAGLFNARYALVPVELALVPDPSGGRATLHRRRHRHARRARDVEGRHFGRWRPELHTRGGGRSRRSRRRSLHSCSLS